METTKHRIGRVTKCLLQTLELCEKEIRDCHSQKLVREDSLRKNVIDNQPIKDQIETYKDLLRTLEQKNHAAEVRFKTSRQEIKKLAAAIEILSKSADMEEIQSLVENYKASIYNHEDIANIASIELESDKSRMTEVNDCIARLNRELEMAATALNFDGENRYKDEINQLDETIDILTEDRDEILATLDKLDLDRGKDGKSKLLTASASKKRKLDSVVGFNPESRSPRATKRVRQTDEPTTLSLPTNDRRDEFIVSDFNQIISKPNIDLPTLFSLFLPPTAAKLTGLSTVPFANLEWITPLSRVIMNKDANSSLFAWKVERLTEFANFILQSYTGFTSSYRICAVDPRASIDTDLDPEAKKISTIVIPLAVTSEKEEADLLFKIISELETLDQFDYQAVWRVLCATH